MSTNRRKSINDMANNNNEIDTDTLTYKNVTVLSKFISEQGKILPRRLTGLKAKQHKHVTRVIKQARIAALLPFVIGKC
uniref:ribosomal protein S18 n=1 Tax=Chrysotila carterae TaxID=13221 RepID=UPI0022F2D6F8|nr:ribosomal protein S18 [Chrysotila carterae]WAK83213.1 ribosomal protein S18 [Chrysotila carterae]